jgi:hypothetical protein
MTSASCSVSRRGAAEPLRAAAEMDGDNDEEV